MKNASKQPIGKENNPTFFIYKPKMSSKIEEKQTNRSISFKSS